MIGPGSVQSARHQPVDRLGQQAASGSVVFGRDIAAAKAVADALDVGMISINGPSGTQEDLPFGGVELFGVGRELGAYGMAEFVNRKVVRVRGEAGRAGRTG
ncbi:aldehyde dehydrogenase family protein [Streptomyces liliifuscus]|uniref:aldehyde dehydrogenase family protein n=1 Tax=Streptomyces liliifuscus TaxID=2797636 RepID=UPI001F279E6F|nr:aldehyde dehydrogenase family protein [Streptomyces liliifuscus]